MKTIVLSLLLIATPLSAEEPESLESLFDRADDPITFEDVKRLGSQCRTQNREDARLVVKEGVVPSNGPRFPERRYHYVLGGYLSDTLELPEKSTKVTESQIFTRADKDADTSFRIYVRKLGNELFYKASELTVYIDDWEPEDCEFDCPPPTIEDYESVYYGYCF